ncbi:MAG: hypothetical protein U1E76_03700 [Planctomycetota bacterium]
MRRLAGLDPRAAHAAAALPRVPSRDTLRSTTALEPHVRRVKFGVQNPSDERFADGALAARTSHRVIAAAVRRLVRDRAAEGVRCRQRFRGLELRASALRLRKRWRPKLAWPYKRCPAALRRARSIMISSVCRSRRRASDRRSQLEHGAAPAIRARRAALHAAGDAPPTAPATWMIVAERRRERARWLATTLDDRVAAELARYIDSLAPQGGTNLESAIRKASEEVTLHGQPTTLVILTDGQDESIPGMLQRMPEIEHLFGAIRVHGNATTPRLFAGGDPAPIDAPEQNLSRFAALLHGRFGSARTKP